MILGTGITKLIVGKNMTPHIENALSESGLAGQEWDTLNESQKEAILKFGELVAKGCMAEVQTIVKDNLKNIHWTIPEEQMCHKIIYLIRTRYGIERK